MKAGASPIPGGVGGATCGHSKCGLSCNVRYVGHTSRISDHHMFHTARAVANIWAAAIVVGLAVVLTGAIAYTSVQAQSDQEEQPAVEVDLTQVMDKLNSMEQELQAVKAACLPAVAAPTISAKGKK